MSDLDLSLDGTARTEGAMFGAPRADIHAFLTSFDLYEHVGREQERFERVGSEGVAGSSAEAAVCGDVDLSEFVRDEMFSGNEMVVGDGGVMYAGVKS